MEGRTSPSRAELCRVLIVSAEQTFIEFLIIQRAVMTLLVGAEAGPHQPIQSRKVPSAMDSTP